MISYNESLINRNEFISSMFFASGFIPLIQSFIFDFIPRIMTRISMSSSSSNSTSNKTQQEGGAAAGNNKFRLGQETFSTLLSAIFLIAALLLYPNPEDEGDAWDIVCGKTLFEAGLIYFITRVLFFVPNPMDEIRKLKNDIEELKQSMAIGLADGYFWNLVREIAVDVRDAPHGLLELRHVGKDKDGNDLEPVRKYIHRFLVLVPRELDAKIDDPIANEINALKKQEIFKDCKIKKSVNRKSSSRMKFVTDLYNISSSSSTETSSQISPVSRGAAGSKKKKETSYQDGIIFDIPTTITALLMSLRDFSHEGEDEQQQEQEGGGGNTKIDTEKFQKEISTFTHRIAWQLKKAKLEDYVKVIEIENLDNLVDKITSVHDYFQQLENQKVKNDNNTMLLDPQGAKVITSNSNNLGGGGGGVQGADLL